MKLGIIGGSQGTGAQLSTLAARNGHEVRRAGTGADAVVVTVGGATGVHDQRAAATRTVVEAMRATGVHRFLVQFSLGAGGSADQLPRALRKITMLTLAKPLVDDAAIGKAYGVSSR